MWLGPLRIRTAWGALCAFPPFRQSRFPRGTPGPYRTGIQQAPNAPRVFAIPVKTNVTTIKAHNFRGSKASPQQHEEDAPVPVSPSLINDLADLSAAENVVGVDHPGPRSPEHVVDVLDGDPMDQAEAPPLQEGAPSCDELSLGRRGWPSSLVLCGHVHEGFGQRVMGATWVMNVAEDFALVEGGDAGFKVVHHKRFTAEVDADWDD